MMADLLFYLLRWYECRFCLFFFLEFFFNNLWLYCDLQNNHLKVVEFLVEKGAKVDQANVEGVNPLLTASQVCLFIAVVA